MERTFGLLKMRFRCLLKERTLRYTPEKASKFLKVCAALHNLCIKEGVHMDLEELDDDGENNGPLHEFHENPVRIERRDGLNARNDIVTQYF